MKVAFLLSVFASMAVLSAPARGEEQVQIDDTVLPKTTPVRLIAFSGHREFLKESQRLRVWRGEVNYTLKVDSAGTPVDCKLTEEFRMNYVNEKLCEVLMSHHTFEPAQDARGVASEGSYEGRINYRDLRAKD
ncbi:MAG: hypothetical protein ACKO1N_09590 [Erythrobacter sp.]